jgi:hypothetical protein
MCRKESGASIRSKRIKVVLRDAAGQDVPGVDAIEDIPSCGLFPDESKPLFCERPAIYYNPQFVSGEIESTPGHMPRLRAFAGQDDENRTITNSNSGKR